MDLQLVIKEFLSYLEVEQNASMLTLAAYRSDLRQLSQFLTEEGLPLDLASLTTSVIRRHIVRAREARNLKPATVARHVNSIRAFCKFAHEQDYMAGNPALPIHAPEIGRRRPVFLTPLQAQQLLSAPAQLRFRNWERDEVAVHALYFAGLRRSELLGLDWDDVDFGRELLHVIGKGNKEREVPLHPVLRDKLWAYLQGRLPLRHPAVLPGDFSLRMNKDLLTARARRYVRAIGLDPSVYTVHKVRHSFATHLLWQGADLHTVKELLGHDDITTTDQYAHSTLDRMRSAVGALGRAPSGPAPGGRPA